MPKERQFNKMLITRACQLSEAFRKTNSDIHITIYPDTIKHYDMCKEVWNALKEEGNTMVYKDVVIHRPEDISK